RGKPGAAYNICRGEAPPLSDVVDLIRARSRVPFRVETDPARLRPVDIPVLLGDASRFRGDTGWTPRKSLDDMVSDLLDYWRGRIRSASDAS
ncbi:MAG TPA: GDP-mannose 4,6 dehydratase, partial [Candidatus Hydrogenedentes bacterium]|nr:GDP-mannose 4,6 dehydratase [Candidatus Hydrogenedentota bacterium]